MSLLDTLAWQDHAACIDLDVDDFFQDDRKQRRANPSGATPAARRACANCTVRLDCLENIQSWETDLSLIAGYRAGMSAEERKDAHRERKRA